MGHGGSSARRYRPPAWLAIALIAAAMLPLIAFISLQAAFSAETERTSVEAAALDHARRIMTDIDAQLERTRGAAAALVTTKAVQEREWAAAYQRAKEIVDQNPDWDAVLIWDRQDGRELIDTTHPFGPSQPVRPFRFNRAALDQPNDLVLSGIELQGEHCPCIYAHAAAGRNSPYVLTVRLYPASFQRILDREAGAGGALVSGLVDADGRFIGRTLNLKQRLGGEASTSVLGAIRNGSTGFYKGVTVEGVKNYTAYSKSPLSGWSIHVAYEPEKIEAVWWKWATATAVSAFASLLIAGVLVTLAVRNFAALRRMDEQAVAAVRAEAAAQLAVARDLHDGVLQFLTGLALRLQGLRHTTGEGGADGDDRDAALNGLQSEIRREQRELRRFIENLGPSTGTIDSEISLTATAAMLSRRWAVRIAVEPDGADALIPERLRKDLDFIVREAVSNAVRHGSAQQITIRVSRDEGIFMMDIQDDGSGFSGRTNAGDKQVAKPATILGRVSNHGGSLDVLSAPSGSSLTIAIPVRR